MIKMSKKVNMLDSKIHKGKKSVLIFVTKNNGKQNLNELYKSKYQKHIACSYDYKLVCVDD